MRAAWTVALALGVLFAGCLEGPAPRERPDDWDSGVELFFISGFRAHSADEERSIVPPDNVTLGMPAYCAAYQDGIRKGGDTCTIISPYRPQYRERDWPWGIEATWDGRGDSLIEQEQDESRRTVVAFDAQGTPIAYWDTAPHPTEESSMAIE